MRIAMVSEHASPLAAAGGPDSGGQNVHVRELSLALAAAGHDVEVLTRRDRADLPEVVEVARGMRVRHVTAGPARPVPKDDIVDHVPRLARELDLRWRIDPPDVVHAHYWMSGLAAVGVARDLRLPLVQTFHALGVVKQRHQGRDDTSPRCRIGAERSVAMRADRVLATCSDERRELVALGVPEDRIAVVPCGVDPDMFRPRPVRVQSDRLRLLTIGRPVPRKGVADVVAALAQVPDAELLVAGGPPAGTDPGSDPDLARLRRAAVDAGVADRVQFLGALEHRAVPALLRTADVVVCAPWYEPFGMVPLEAMAAARPVIATAVGGLLDTVVHGRTGLLVPPRDPGQLAAAVRQLASRTARARLGAAGRARVLEHYTWTGVAAATEQVYRAVRGAAAPVRVPAIGGVR
jgi:glycosyltransferase involved in cell wall biosynthesis